MNIAEFHQAAREAVPGVWIKAEISHATGEEAPTYRAITCEKSETCHGTANDGDEAIRRLVADRARTRAEKIEAAKKLLDSIG